MMDTINDEVTEDNSTCAHMQNIVSDTYVHSPNYMEYVLDSKETRDKLVFFHTTA